MNMIPRTYKHMQPIFLRMYTNRNQPSLLAKTRQLRRKFGSWKTCTNTLSLCILLSKFDIYLSLSLSFFLSPFLSVSLFFSLFLFLFLSLSLALSLYVFLFPCHRQSVSHALPLTHTEMLTFLICSSHKETPKRIFNTPQRATPGAKKARGEPALQSAMKVICFYTHTCMNLRNKSDLR